MKIRYIIPVLSLLVFSNAASDAQVSRNMNQLGHLSVGAIGGALNDIWGYADTLGNEYALVGMQTGVVIVDVTVPSNPILLHTITGPNTTWRDIRVYNDYAYAICEENTGLLIIDLRYVQDSVPHKYTDLGIGFDDAHNISIDENGIAYLVGGNGLPTNGAVMIDLKPDPMNPVHLGNYTNNYVHDVIVRNDTMYTSEIYTGKFAVVDVTNKLSPNVITTQSTSLNFTHQAWLSDDSKHLFVVDEISGAYIDAFDISDLSNIEKVDRIQSNPGSGVIPHNTFYINGYLVTSYYRDGVTVHDVSRPHNMAQVGYYDTYSTGSGNGFQGCWGVYPYLPSGNIIASDRNTGLHILSANYQRACYVEGLVTDVCTGAALSNVTVKIIGGFTGNEHVTGFGGSYAVATVDAGAYDIVFSKIGYINDTLKNVVLTQGVVQNLNVGLSNGNSLSFSVLSQSDASCFGESDGEVSALATGGTGPYSYLWSNGESASSVDGLEAGVYTVVATDIIGCTASASLTVSQPQSITVTTGKSNVSCAGGSNGTATGSASSGNAPYSYSWDTQPVQTSQSIAGLKAGVYNLTVVDANGCIKHATVNVTAPNQMLAFSIPANPTGGAGNGSINLLVSGGVNPYTYNWSNGATTEDVSNLSAGFYFCQVNDRNGCAVIEAVTLLNGPSIDFVAPGTTNGEMLAEPRALVFPNPGKGLFTVKLSGYSDKELNVELFEAGGRMVHSDRYVMDNSSADILLDLPSHLHEGVYLLRITDSRVSSSNKIVIYP